MAGPGTNIDVSGARDAFFGRVVHQQARLLYRVAHSVLRNPADAEDAVADALLKILRTGAWRTVTNERAFLARSVWRSALDRFNGRPPAGQDETDLLALQDAHPTPEQSTIRNREHDRLHAMIDRLPADLREPLLFSAVQELNSREIAEILNLPEGTVRTRLMRARQQLRAQYEALQGTTRDPGVAAQGPHR